MGEKLSPLELEVRKQLQGKDNRKEHGLKEKGRDRELATSDLRAKGIAKKKEKQNCGRKLTLKNALRKKPEKNDDKPLPV